MTLLTWLRTRALALLVGACGLAALYVMARLVGVGHYEALLVAGVMAAFCLLAAVLDALREHSFWRDLAQVGADADAPLALAEALERPVGAREQVVYDALRAVSAEANARAAELRCRVTDHRDFVEAWVHEVKTPLAAADLVVENLADPALRPVAAELARVDAYVEQALYYARASSLDRDYLVRRIVLSDLVSEAVKARARTLVGARVAVGMGGLDREVFADPKWLAFVLGQLIDNAVKYRPDTGARIDFTAVACDEGAAEERVVLTVRDNGCGIAPADLPRVFDRAFTGENGRTRARSTGMGLYLVRELCEKMGLAVSIDSEQGAWTAVRIGFPTNRFRLAH